MCHSLSQSCGSYFHYTFFLHVEFLYALSSLEDCTVSLHIIRVPLIWNLSFMSCLFIYLFAKTKCFSHVLCFASSSCSQGSLDNISVILVCFPAAPQLSPEALHQEAELEDLLESKVAGGEPAGAAVTVQTNMPRKTLQNSLLSSASNMLTNTPSSYRPL